MGTTPLPTTPLSFHTPSTTLPLLCTLPPSFMPPLPTMPPLSLSSRRPLSPTPTPTVLPTTTSTATSPRCPTLEKPSTPLPLLVDTPVRPALKPSLCFVNIYLCIENTQKLPP